MTDDELDSVVREIQVEFPNSGYRRVYSQLLSRDMKVSQFPLNCESGKLCTEQIQKGSPCGGCQSLQGQNIA